MVALKRSGLQPPFLLLPFKAELTTPSASPGAQHPNPFCLRGLMVRYHPKGVKSASPGTNQR